MTNMSCVSSDLCALPLRQLRRPGDAASATEFDGRHVLAVVGRFGFFDLAGRHFHDVDGIGDDVSGALVAFGGLWHTTYR